MIVIIQRNKLLFIMMCSLLIWGLFGYMPHPTFSAPGQHDLEQKIDKYLQENETTSAGVTTILVNGDDITYRMKGYANLENKELVDEETVFEWGSVSKILIWISVLQLVEAGKMDLETDIHQYLPKDFHSKISFNEPVTMTHLMNHTAGFDDSYTDLMVPYNTDRISLRQALDTANIKQVFQPGQIVSYSNYGSCLAAFIVEEISGVDYREYVRENIFEPLRMSKTAIDAKQNDNPWVKEQRKKVKGYRADFREVEPNNYVIPMYPAGSVTGVATDLQMLLQALLTEDGTPLFNNSKTIELLFQPSLYYPETDIPRIAHGLFFLPSSSESVFGHGGNTIAFSSSLYIDRQEQKGVLVLTNTANETTFTLGIPDIIFGKYPHNVNRESLEDSSTWSGIYEPARVPRHGFSKVYGLFLRGKTKQYNDTHLITNDMKYFQLEPGIFLTEDDFGAYALDVYSEHLQSNKVLSSPTTDLLYIPDYKHIFEWSIIIFGGIVILFSSGLIFVSFVKIVRGKKPSILLVSQHILNVLLLLNIIWIIIKTLSMTTYLLLKPFLIGNIIYMIISLTIGVTLIMQMKNKKMNKYSIVITMLTILSTFILCLIILYWEFYY